MYEGWQHHMWDDATGIMTWMSQPAHPSPRSGRPTTITSTRRVPTGAYARRANRCISSGAMPTIPVKAVNTTREPLEATATARVYDLDGRLLPQFTQQLRVSLAANTTAACST